VGFEPEQNMEGKIMYAAAAKQFLIARVIEQAEPQQALLY
jgi:hypothetical protein